MNKEIYSLCDQIDEVKLKLTSLEYKNMVDTLKKINDCNNNVCNSYQNEYQNVPKRGSDSWYRLHIEEQAKYSGMELEYYKDWIWDNLSTEDVEWYKLHLEEVPEHLEEHFLIYPEQNINSINCNCCLLM